MDGKASTLIDPDKLHQPMDSEDSPSRSLRSHAIATDLALVSNSNQPVHEKTVDAEWLRKAMQWMPALVGHRLMTRLVGHCFIFWGGRFIHPSPALRHLFV